MSGEAPGLCILRPDPRGKKKRVAEATRSKHDESYLNMLLMPPHVLASVAVGSHGSSPNSP